MPAGTRPETSRHPTLRTQDLDDGFSRPLEGRTSNDKKNGHSARIFPPVPMGPAARQEWRPKAAFRDGATASYPARAAQQAGKRLAESRIVLCGKYSSTCRRVRRRPPHDAAGHRARTNRRRTYAGRLRPERRHKGIGTQHKQGAHTFYGLNTSLHARTRRNKLLATRAPLCTARALPPLPDAGRDSHALQKAFKPTTATAVSAHKFFSARPSMFFPSLPARNSRVFRKFIVKTAARGARAKSMQSAMRRKCRVNTTK